MKKTSLLLCLTIQTPFHPGEAPAKQAHADLDDNDKDSGRPDIANNANDNNHLIKDAKAKEADSDEYQSIKAMHLDNDNFCGGAFSCGRH